MKYVVKMKVLLIHCRAEFMKQVLPRLLRPVAPRSIGTADRPTAPTCTVRITKTPGRARPPN